MHLTIRVVPEPEFTSDDAAALIRELRTWVGKTVKIDVETVGEIARTANGKFKFVVSDLARSKLGM